MTKKIVLILMIVILLIISSFSIEAKIKNINLNGYIIYIDAGHGGKDNGASVNNVLEDEINLSISSLLLQELIDCGASVVTTRSGDYDLASNYDKNRKNKDLKKRVELINVLNPDIFISIHLNTFADENINGGQVFYQNKENSILLANILQERFNKLSNKNKKSKKGEYYLLENADSIGVLIECGFLTNKKDRENLIEISYQKKITKIIVESIYEYFYKSS